MQRFRLLVAALSIAALPLFAAAATTPTIVTISSAKWQPVPQFKGWQMAPIVGDPSKAGVYYAYLLKAPDGGKAPPHFHAMTENVTVLSGTILVGLGSTMNVATMKPLGPGSVVSIPGGVHHYAMAKGDTIIEVSGIGPDTTTFVH